MFVVQYLATPQGCNLTNSDNEVLRENQFENKEQNIFCVCGAGSEWGSSCEAPHKKVIEAVTVSSYSLHIWMCPQAQ